MAQGFHPVKRPGALTRKAHAAGESPGEFARAHYHSPGLLGKEARFAVIAKGWHHGGRKRGRRSRKARHLAKMI